MATMVEPGWRRVPAPELLRATTPGARVYQREVLDGHLSVMVGREPAADRSGLIWHLSISHRINGAKPQPGRYPTWDEPLATCSAPMT